MAQTTRREGQLSRLSDSVEQVWLAGLGALALTEQEGSSFFRTLVKKGERVERRTRDRLDEAMTAAKKVPSDTIEKIRTQADDAVENALHRLGVPTHDEITSLSRRIEQLARSLEERPAARRAAPRRTARKATASRPKAH